MNSIILKPKIFVICPRILQLDSYQNFCISNPRTYFALIWLKDLIRRKFVVAIYFRSNSRFLFPSFESWREEQGMGGGGVQKPSYEGPLFPRAWQKHFWPDPLEHVFSWRHDDGWQSPFQAQITPVFLVSLLRVSI